MRHFRRFALLFLALTVSPIAAGCRNKLDARGNPVEVGRIRLRTYPAGAKVWIDGELRVERTPATLLLKEGRYELKIQLEGGEPMLKTIVVSPGDNREIDLKPPRPPEATVTVLSDIEGAKVSVNGYTRGPTPLLKAVTIPGPIDLTVQSPDGRAKSVRGELKIGEQKVVEVFFGDVDSEVEPLAIPATPMSQPPAKAQLTLGAQPEAEVFDESERLLGRTPLTQLAMDPGEHRLLLRSIDGRYQKTVVIELEANTPAIFRFRFTAEDERPAH